MKRLEIPTGSEFGHLKVLSLWGPNSQGLICWMCRCDCGEELPVSGSELLAGKRSSCGHTRSKEVLTGKVFGSWSVISGKVVQKLKGRYVTFYWCRCECGTKKLVRAAQLLIGVTTKCRVCSDTEQGKGRRKSLGESAGNTVLSGYKRQAKLRHLEWSLTEEEFFDLVKQNCFYCGCVPSNEYTSGRCFGSFIYNGIDRVINLIGYRPDNVVPCCKVCNLAKLDMTQQEFLSWAQRVVKHSFPEANQALKG